MGFILLTAVCSSDVKYLDLIIGAIMLRRIGCVIYALEVTQDSNVLPVLLPTYRVSKGRVL